jgi:hypothetical protein
MYQCSIYDRSLRFSRAIYGVLVLIGFLTRDHRYVFVVIIMLALGTISVKLNIPYDLHYLFVKYVLRKRFPAIQKESTELRYVSAMTGILLLIGFLCIYYDRFVTFGWIWLLVMSLFLFLACFAGFCVATLSYAIFKKLFGIGSHSGNLL